MVTPYYEHAGITIYHGDCRGVLPHVTADVLVTDPPYGIGFAGQPTKWQRRAGATAESWDDAVVSEVAEMVGRYSTAIVWGGNYYPLPPTRGWLCWVKPDAPPSMGGFELAWTNRDAVSRFITWSIGATNPERLGHPTQKPLRIMTWTLGFAPEGVIVDPFAGSGTTLLAAKELGRRAIGIEIEERYCEMAAKRLAQDTLFQSRTGT